MTLAVDARSLEEQSCQISF